MGEVIFEKIQARVKKREYYFTLHAGDRMIKRHISVSEVEEALFNKKAKVIEEYLEDARGPSCLIFGMTREDRPLHIQCTYPPNIGIITVYEPKANEWENWITRKGGK